MAISFFAVLWLSQKKYFSHLGWVWHLEEDVIHFGFTLSLYLIYLNYQELFFNSLSRWINGLNLSRR